MKCEICKRSIKHKHFWYLEHIGYKNLVLCEECGKSLSEQLGDDLLPLYYKTWI